ncbi:hypothetical protein NIES2101_41760 [Calothrix sp. HK-06]|nr:hypothetical protein NIES2101_41760 [Calothrix sp. HK-06]
MYQKNKLTGCRLLNGLRILILDELECLNALTYLLEVEGASVIGFSSVAKVVNKLKFQSVDIMLINLKIIKKYALAKQIKVCDVKIPKQIPKIGVADSHCNLDWASIRDLGCYDHLSTGFNSDQIVHSILCNIEQDCFFQQLEKITIAIRNHL